MTRKSFVWLEGELREKGPDNTVVIGDQIWCCIGREWAPLGLHSSSAPMVMPDIKPYQSTITGETINSRSVHRQHLRDHNCIEVGNERPQPKKPEWSALKGLREELRARINN